MSHVGKCNGGCCRAITLNLPPEKVAQIAAVYDYWNATGRPCSHDAQFVVKHFKFIRMTHVEPTSGMHEHGFKRAEYRCDALVDNKCSVYAERPNLCRSYPHIERCLVLGCTVRRRRDFPASRWEDDGGSLRHAHETNHAHDAAD